MVTIATRAPVWRSVMGVVCLVSAGAASTGCGEESALGSGGTAVVRGTETFERPEVGTIRVGSGMCTATLVAADVLVSAAHCVDYGTRDVPGNYGVFTVDRGGGETPQRFTIDRYRSFGRYDADDVLLLHLARPVPASVATPAGLGSAHPARGEPLSLYGYGCTRRNTSMGSGVKRKLALRQGDVTTNLCPGDSGGPVIQDATGLVLRVNSAYIVDAEGRDIFGDVPRHYTRLIAQIRAWGSTAGGGTPGGGASDAGAGGGGGAAPDAGAGGGGGSGADAGGGGSSGEACGPYAGWNVWSCIDEHTRVRCTADRLERVTCTTRCVVRPPGVDDECAPEGGGGSGTTRCAAQTSRAACLATPHPTLARRSCGWIEPYGPCIE